MFIETFAGGSGRIALTAQDNGPSGERDPILKERFFGLIPSEGNHGEDVKEHWWALDCTPTHSWMQWLYRYPQAAYPYEQLREENAARVLRKIGTDRAGAVTKFSRSVSSASSG